ncbi:GntR family transcriptional regulator [Dactylosporangium sp. NPDC051541]|uniref:GntR family transcriptional regulator n=1 Tax=Dactylosporangium sp. NPDC051541 TaxID=3363977 RepID=UPI003798C42F
MEPKYAAVLTTLQERIANGHLPAGTLLPSESQLTREFRTSRSTVVRALRHLRHQGWVVGQQGKGRVILGRPVTALSALPRRVQYLLQADRHAECLGVYRMPATPRIAATLCVNQGTDVFGARYRLTTLGTTPMALTTVFTAVRLPQERDLLAQLESTAGRRPHRVIERLGARLSTAAEADALSLPQPRSVAVALLTVHDAGDRPYLVVDAILSRESAELTETYEI